MSNEYKDWLEDLKNAPIGSADHKRWLLTEYPWLSMDESEAINYLDTEDSTFIFVNEEDDNVFSYIDCAPEGWAKLCEDLCAEIKPLLERVGYEKEYSLCQVKEKYGSLRWYDNGVPDEILDEYNAIVRKYEELSFHTCCVCGAPATKVSTGWICPFCDECAKEINGTFKEIE